MKTESSSGTFHMRMTTHIWNLASTKCLQLAVTVLNSWKAYILFPSPKATYVLATYRENGQGEPHCVEDSGCDGTVMERILDAVIITEKASLIRFYFGQV